MPLATAENTNKLGRMGELIDSLIKQAMEGDSAPANDPPTAHPVGKVTTEVPAAEGTHAAEVESEVKAEVGETAVDEGDTSTSQPVPENTDVTVTGPDESPPEGKPNNAMDDPGTSHPAKATVGTKHSSWTLSTVSSAGNDLLAKIAMLLPSGESPATTSEEAGVKAASEAVEQLNRAGSFSPEQAYIIDAMEKQAEASAYKVKQYLAGFIGGAQEAIKEAEAKDAAPTEETQKVSYTKAASDNTVPPNQMAQLLLKAAMDLGAAGAVGSEYADPGIGAQGAPPEMGPAPESANPSGMSETEEDQLAALIQQIMAETGMSLEEVMASLMALAQQGGGGEMAGGEMAPPAETAPPVEAAGPVMGAEPAKVASAKITPQQVQKALRDLLKVK